MSRLVIIAGPSGVGKSPLHAALTRLAPEISRGLRRLVLYNSRAPRPGEADGVDYHFRPRAEIEALRDRPGFTVMEVRGDLQALDRDELQQALAAGDVVFEGNPFIGTALLEFATAGSVPVCSVFVSPLSQEEIVSLGEAGVVLPELVTEVMRRKLLRRARRQKGLLSVPDLEEVERRAGGAYAELRMAPRFTWVLPNHDGEDSEHWSAFYHPLGDARRTCQALLEILAGGEPALAEHWSEELLP